ncbi:similar to Saccharomyces cerevisiae YDR414C ERD1 Predicted membrane protein required for the retention of lumenal endoplasmic reticulum proteins [Maudiozyma barnettii]|uniref:Similar to Saccharomyces cerevisiae YDR414C ERD1 Predicted membrane protein required for the retention of lumenal endoplasmic reticulum proteins n=1 Tax=Maudiozyma barnettii TaxID=61262 RepID=A0A8H2VDV8_9SACH|nr:Erd1p [Kazachstania barnettii]CAB4253711.1 similar to Saccharomyces cerevisiae YDR414C ERD1 Predicted membrane protein required for the retention of lumenal endoplasmic reticulum proteins [Kazachstania barnettii]CAD1781452.1 similar to Saccharomyces cerevisiae YDR414C ERD1 Predicted membrane protein required for the retention of lumenal endoplasmic reticulum proteins [Kazachstania barnettii]
MKFQDGTDKGFLLNYVQLPVPQRLNILLFIAIWLWYFIVKYLNSNKINISDVLQLKLRNDMHQAPTNGQLLRFSYVFAWKVTKIFVFTHSIVLLVFSNSNEHDTSGIQYILVHALPLLQFLVLIILILRESEIIRYCSTRLLLIEPNPRILRNVYILISDTLTSFNKPLIDFTLFTSLLFGKPMTHFDLFLSSLPSGVRIFQCLREYQLLHDTELLMNAGKYCSNLPIIGCTWFSRTHNMNNVSQVFYSIQMCFLVLNSSYTFYWDVRRDWTIPSIFTLRKNKLIFKPKVYYFAIALDFTIRYWWIGVAVYTQNKSINHIFFKYELYYFEIIRRAIWIIFKLESEYANRPIKS